MIKRIVLGMALIAATISLSACEIECDGPGADCLAAAQAANNNS